MALIQMKLAAIISSCVAVFAIVVSTVLWQQNQRLQAEVLRLTNEQNEVNAAATELEKITDANIARVREQADTQKKELVKLRGEVSQLRTSGQSELQTLRAENARLKAAAASPQTASTPGGGPRADHFPRESWSFAGYNTPENALVSAIWAMREGDPKTYLNSLSAEEQARVTAQWQGKSEAEIAAKHQSDVSKINSMQIVDRQPVSDNEMMINVYIGGAERMEKVRMIKSGDDWKFGGFIRPPQQPAPSK